MLSLSFERRLSRRGFSLIAGIDEAGRGPLAGPIVAAAVILPLDVKLRGLDDSKKILPHKRARLFNQIKKKAVSIGIAVVSHRTIDQIGMGKANQLVMQAAFEKLRVLPDHLLLDGKFSRVKTDLPQQAIIGGDHKVASIAAASIIAKVTRDRLMLKYHARYPAYHFDRHKGYGTKLHLKLLYELGPCAIHRRSFFPVSELA